MSSPKRRRTDEPESSILQQVETEGIFLAQEPNNFFSSVPQNIEFVPNGDAGGLLKPTIPFIAGQTDVHAVLDVNGEFNEEGDPRDVLDVTLTSHTHSSGGDQVLQDTEEGVQVEDGEDDQNEEDDDVEACGLDICNETEGCSRDGCGRQGCTHVFSTCTLHYGNDWYCKQHALEDLIECGTCEDLFCSNDVRACASCHDPVCTNCAREGCGCGGEPGEGYQGEDDTYDYDASDPSAAQAAARTANGGIPVASIPSLPADGSEQHTVEDPLDGFGETDDDFAHAGGEFDPQNAQAPESRPEEQAALVQGLPTS